MVSVEICLTALQQVPTSYLVLQELLYTNGCFIMFNTALLFHLWNEMYHFVGTNEEAHVLLDVSQATGLEDHCQTNITKKKNSLMGFFPQTKQLWRILQCRTEVLKNWSCIQIPLHIWIATKLSILNPAHYKRADFCSSLLMAAIVPQWKAKSLRSGRNDSDSSRKMRGKGKKRFFFVLAKLIWVTSPKLPSAWC